MQTPIKILTTPQNQQLGNDIASQLDAHVISATIAKFPDGEWSVELLESIRGDVVYVVGGTHSPVNDNLMLLALLADACRRAGARSINLVCPYFGYSRQDRRPECVRSPISAKVAAQVLESSGYNLIMTMDIHSLQSLGFFTIPTISVSATHLFIADMYRNIKSGDYVVVTPDVGGAARGRAIAKGFGDCDLVVIDKRRNGPGQSEVMNIIGNVEGKTCIVVDDMVDSGGTLLKGCQALMKAGSVKTIAYATHGILSGNAAQYVGVNTALSELVITDTIPFENQHADLYDIRQLPIAGLLSEMIRRIETNQSTTF